MSHSNPDRPPAPASDEAAAIGRRPHEGAGPCAPRGGRRPGRQSGRRPGGLAGALAAGPVVAALLACAALLAACGGSSGGAQPPALPASATPSAGVALTPAPGSAPFAGSPRQAVAAYWALVAAGDYAGLRAACTPGSAAALTATSADIKRARVVRVARVRREPGGAQVQADVSIVPARTATPWGDPGTHTLFVKLTGSASGGWLVASWGTSP